MVETDASDEEALTPLKDSWEDGWSAFIGIGGGAMKMKCDDCERTFTKSHTKAMFHKARVAGGDITPCAAANVPTARINRSKELLDHFIAAKANKNSRRHEMATSVAKDAAAKTQTYVARKNSGNTTATPPSLTSQKRAAGVISLPSEEPSSSSKKPKNTTKQSVLITTKPGKVGHHALHMVIADMIHSNALPHRLSECPKMKHVLNMAKLVGNDYKPPTRALVGGDLLDANFEHTFKKSMVSLKESASTFRLTVSV